LNSAGDSHVQIEVADHSIARQIQEVLFQYSTEHFRSDQPPPGPLSTRTRSIEILQRDGLTLEDIQYGTKQMSSHCVDALMQLYDEIESAFRNAIVLGFSRATLFHDDLTRAARWLVNHLVREKDPDTRSWILMDLHNHLAIPEIADDLIRILKDRNSPVRDGCLFDVFVMTKDLAYWKWLFQF
jgi:hypothetical protein